VPPPPEDFSIGVEEEFQIVDASTRELRPRAGRLLRRAREAVGDDVTNELYLSQIEIGTPVCRTLADVRTELLRHRRALVDAARQVGSRIAAAGTHPFSHWEDQPLTPKPRYRVLAAEFQQLMREHVTFGCHIHVGIADREAAIQVMNRTRPWHAVLIALSANSPYWLGADTGYSSYRTEIIERLPMSGLPHEFSSRAEFDELVATLVDLGIIEDGSNIYWHARPSSHVETLEFRAADVCMTVDQTVMLAGLVRALARAGHAEWSADRPVERLRPELLRAARWQASRFGLEDSLIDFQARRAVPAADLVDTFLRHVRPSLESAGEWDEVSTLVRETLDRGNGARLQRDVFERTGRIEEVVDLIVSETERGVV
jgi:carboxylate-amine ligase